MKAKSISAQSVEEFQSALQKSISDGQARPKDGQGFAPTLAIVFISIKQDKQAVCEILHRANIDIVGANSSGEFVDGNQSEGGIATILLDIPKEDYTILFEEIGGRTPGEAATHLAEQALQQYKKPAFIFCSSGFTKDGVFLEGEPLIRSIERVVGPQVTLFGGMAGDDLTFTGSHVFTYGKDTDYGMVALVLDEDKISLNGIAISGWKPVGVSRTITGSEGNMIFTIDDKPALEMYLRYLGEDIDSKKDQLDFFNSIGKHYPFQIEREGREPKMCNPMGYDKDKKALICESDVPQGSRLRFSTPPDFEIIDTVITKANKLKMEAKADADALLIFSCVGRLSALGPMAQQENEGLQNVWNAPMVGFYTYGEYGKGENGVHEFHSTTNSWVAIKEK